ncbi:ATP-dependent DNA helicase RecQ [Deinococcus sp. HSC-46F16]|uniref:RecQ family ATP-dependent DNA helicase n=1 Tax=Deinococcus sp. HSC-46F16 TaxID=2910968 RepID=UPI0020A140F3|nr:RecQ family ATP-dependent DNA helicase [Deinococcus sp. HSC-46F16]MCP2014787.1 ATP-dependent DNA helicase RecQ [Deinococcus sp. HSC-46F16]
MSPLLRRVLEYLRAHGPQPEEDLLEVFGLKRALLTRMFKEARGQVRQQGEYLFLPGQEERVAELHGAPTARVTSYVILDTETTSVDRTEARLLEVAALRIEEGRLVETLQLLVSGERVPRVVTELTGITQEELDREGQPLAEVLQALLAFLGDLPLVGHNALSFDVPVLRRLCREQGLKFQPPFVLDTLLLAPLAFAAEEPPVEGYGLEGLHACFCGEVHDDAHRALADCAATSRVLDRMIARLHALPADVQTLLAALPAPELALAFDPVQLTRAQLEALSARVAGAVTGVSAVWSSGRQAHDVGEMLPSPRSGQMQMAQAVSETLSGPGRLVVEAPTGTGKTRAYLYPALLRGQPGKPVVISTHTKQLQDQIVQEARDLAADGFGVRVVALKGQSNYLCPERLHLLLTRRFRPDKPGEAPGTEGADPEAAEEQERHLPGRLVMPPGEARAVALLALHVRAGEYGALPPSAVTRSPEYLRAKIVTSTVATRCRGECPFSGACAYHRTQALVPQANVVVVNHALLLRNQLSGLEQENLPFSRVVVDEAHDLQDAAMSALRREVGSDGMLSVAREFLRRTQGEPSGLLPSIEKVASSAGNTQLAGYAQGAASAFDVLVTRVDTWQAALHTFAMQFGQGSEAFGFQAAIDPLPRQSAEWRAVAHASEELTASLKYCAGFIPSLAQRSEYQLDLEALLARLNDQIETLGVLLTQGLPGAHVYAVSAGEHQASIWAVPLWLSAALEELWQKTASLVFTSATLRVPGTWPAEGGSGEPEDFGVFQRDLALPEAQYMVLPPVLPYAQGHVLLTNHLPLVHHPDFPALVGQELDNLVPQTPHQALHIFTANDRLRRASRSMSRRHLDSVRDGTQRTVQDLRRGEGWHALGSAGFLQGVDIRDLALVSLDKTPFPIPDLVLEAQRRDVNDFEKYWNTLYLPRAVLKFVQGFGRLIRNDRAGLPPGAFVVWDKRLAFAHYQDRFLGALPIPPENVRRARNREDFYAQLGQLWGKPLTFEELVSPKMRLIHRYREELRGLGEPERRHKLEEALVDLFEFPPGGFREGQYAGVTAALDGVDVLSVMPTGAGKSLVFQLPACLGDGYTVVISPLVALIQDQVSRLQQLGLPAAGLWGGLSRAEQDSTLEDVRAGRVKLLYLAPERVRKSAAVRKLLGEQPPERVVYDEAHTLLEWGHDFRPDYLHVRKELHALGVKAAVSAFTATATPETRRRLIAVLEMDAPERTELGVRRHNLYYQVVDVKPRTGAARRGGGAAGEKPKVSRDEVLLTMLAGLKTNEDTRDGRAIVYVGSRAKAERLAALIGEIGVEVAAYHAGLSPAVRTELLDQFQARLIRVMVATNAFGMGVDAPDIHLVVHYDAPLSLESYVQEAGRAGRDPKIQARAVLLWSTGSERRAKYLIDHSYPDAAQAQTLLNVLKNGVPFPTLSELAAQEGVDLNTLPTLLHLLEVSGAIRYSYVPGLCRVYPYYGVPLPEDAVVRELVERTRTEPAHLSRLYRTRAADIEDRLIGLQREGVLGVMLLEPALKIDVRQDRIGLTAYEAQVAELKRAKHARFQELKKMLLDGRTCRGYQLQLHFEHRGEQCGNCDVCAPQRPAPWEGVTVDFEGLWNPRKELLRLLAHLEKLEHFVGKSTLVRILRNEDSKGFHGGDPGTAAAPKPFHWKEKSAPNFGKLRFLRGQLIRDALERLCEAGFVQVEQRSFRAASPPLPILVLTDKGRREVKGWTTS